MITWDELHVDLDNLINNTHDYINKTNFIYMKYMRDRTLAKEENDIEKLAQLKKQFEEDLKNA